MNTTVLNVLNSQSFSAYTKAVFFVRKYRIFFVKADNTGDVPIATSAEDGYGTTYCNYGSLKVSFHACL
jgi:hypothetical protein